MTPTSSEGKDKDKSQGQGTDKGKQQGKGEGDGGGVPTVLAGPTCDSSDISYQGVPCDLACVASCSVRVSVFLSVDAQTLCFRASSRSETT